jgi:hypothetical protein
MMNDITQILMALIMTSTEHRLTHEEVTDALTTQDSIIVVGYEDVWDANGDQVDIVLWKGEHQIITRNWLSTRIIGKIVEQKKYDEIPFRFEIDYKDDTCMCTRQKQYIIYEVERRL